ncbi:MAG: MarR family transcriptional regulator [Actinomycetales bacterium]|nr:MarR family transcriptional regulator [Actinomycetales bacterium]
MTRVPADVALHFEDVRWPRSTLVSFGTTTVMAGLSRIRDGFRLHLPMPQPLAAGDRVLVRDPGGRTVLGGLVIRDAAAVVEPAPQEVSAHPGAAVLIAHLHDHPLCPPEPSTLDGWGIGVGELNALSAAGQILYLGRGLALGINAPAQLLAVLADLPGEFTVSEVRTALGLSRARTLAILEYADRSGLTERLPDGTHRRVR